MKIGLLGFEFESENKGCEALSYSFLSILSEMISDNIEVVYYFSNCGMGHVPEHFKEIMFIQIPLKIKDISFRMIKSFSKCDYVFDVTMGDSFSDIYSKEVCLSNFKFKKLAELFSKNYILLPQTYGPFYDKKVKNQAESILKKANRIYCRDTKSLNYIKELFNINDALLVTDLAFFLPFNKEIYSFSSKEKIGINVSGLLWRGGFTKDNQFDLALDYQKYIISLIEWIIKNTNYEVHLISHVINEEENAHDDDYSICKKLSSDFSNNCVLAPKFSDPIEAKSYIANMNLFIGSRMHSTIAAFSSGVPVIPVSYSRKFEGLFDDLNYKYLVHGKTDSTKLALNKTIEWLSNFSKLESCIKESENRVKELKNLFLNDFSKCIER